MDSVDFTPEEIPTLRRAVQFLRRREQAMPPAAHEKTREGVLLGALCLDDQADTLAAAQSRQTDAAPAPECLRDDVSYAVQWRRHDGRTSSYAPVDGIDSREEADEYAASLQQIADPGVEIRAVEIRLTHTALPAPDEVKRDDVEHGPVAARLLRSGDRVDLYAAERLVWKVEYLHAGNYLRLHTVPPTGEHPGHHVFTQTPSDVVRLISRGPAVDVIGWPVSPESTPQADDASASDPKDNYPGRKKTTGGRAVHATRPSGDGTGSTGACGMWFGTSDRTAGVDVDQGAEVTCQACVKALVRKREAAEAARHSTAQ